MKPLSWVKIGRVKVDRIVFQELQRQNLEIVFHPSASCDRKYPWVFLLPARIPQQPLHVFVRQFFKDYFPPFRQGENVHHINKKKNDARRSNLQVLSVESHARIHAGGKQKFSPRKRLNLMGFYKPHSPEPIRRPHHREIERMEDGIEKKTKSKELAEAFFTFEDAVRLLKEALPGLRAEIDPRGSGKRIPPPPSRPRREDRLLGIKIRKGLYPDEAALLRLLVKHEHGRQFDLDAVAAESGVPRYFIEVMLREPAVDHAISNWRTLGRIQPPSNPKKLQHFGRCDSSIGHLLKARIRLCAIRTGSANNLSPASPLKARRTLPRMRRRELRDVTGRLEAMYPSLLKRLEALPEVSKMVCPGEPAEIALGLLLIDHDFDVLAVAHELEAPLDLIEVMANRDSIPAIRRNWELRSVLPVCQGGR